MGAVKVIRHLRALLDVDRAAQAPGKTLLVAPDGTTHIYVDPPGVSEVAPYAVRVDDTGGSPDVSYVGEADPGSATSAAVWRIKRLTDDGEDVTIEWADGDALFNNEWDDRLGIVYS